MVGAVDADDGVVAVGGIGFRLHGFDLGSQTIFHIIGFKRIGNHCIEDDVGVGLTGDYAKVVDADLGGNLLGEDHDLCFKLGGDGIIHSQRVQMDHGVAAQLFF